MTLADLLHYANSYPAHVLFYFLLIPFAALLASWMEREEGHLPPWNYLFSTLVYLVAVPAILSVAYTAYRWFFDRETILNTNLLLQILPIASMLLTFFIVKRSVKIDTLPGFGRLSGMVMMIVATMLILYGLDRFRLIGFTAIPFHYLLLVFFGLLFAIRFGWRRIGG
ncbi:hypothetical protein [Neolewinella antarctica]|uniref:FlaA1/EpsC-like NDP-sugar epimerase n=1 Tax=Neolewinella antarctica TaxID=442734 RepID=A0ABX0XEL3_9BACT|nr:hypothetical protein [Neolewinella antarctica]NJC27759.1 FlaA1/EpsC-like NDP-sugar epimerase [Neolewinella antarctica]